MARIEFLVPLNGAAGSEAVDWPAGGHAGRAPTGSKSPSLPSKRLREALADLGPLQPGQKLSELPPPPKPVRTARQASATTDDDDMSAGRRDQAAAPEMPPPTQSPALSVDRIAGALASVAADGRSRSEAAIAEIAGSDHLDDAQERPPMMIERALAARVSGYDPAAKKHVSSVPGLAVGFALSLLAGGALYAYLTLI